eukprot:1908478-Rhodomonas_salina.4
MPQAQPTTTPPTPPSSSNPNETHISWSKTSVLPLPQQLLALEVRDSCARALRQPELFLVLINRGHQRPKRRLRRGPAHRVHRPVHHVSPGFHRCHHARDSSARCIVRVNVDGNVRKLLPQRSDQLASGCWLEQSSHVLDTVAQNTSESVSATLSESNTRNTSIPLALACASFAPRSASQAFPRAGTANYSLSFTLSTIPHLLAELEHDVVGVARVTDGVGSSQEHLERNIGNCLSEYFEPLPRALAQEAQAHVERGPAPHLKRIGACQRPRGGGGDPQHVDGPHARRKERLVRVTPRGVPEAGPQPC